MKAIEIKPVRIRIKTEKLLKTFNTSSIDESIIKMWNKLCKQGKEIKSLRAYKIKMEMGNGAGRDLPVSEEKKE